MSVSRDFIDSYSPEVPMGRRRLEFRRPAGTLVRAIAQSGTTTLFFGFRNRENLLKTLISLPKRRRVILALGQEGLQRAVQRDRLVDLGARAGPIGAEPDQFPPCPHRSPSPPRRGQGPPDRPGRRPTAWCGRPSAGC